MSPEDDSPARKVWVLMFDQLQTEHALPKGTRTPADNTIVEPGDSVFSPFDDLDLQSSFFEQYMLQEARDSSVVTDMLGGIDAVERFTAGLRAANKSARHVRLVCLSGHSGEVRRARPPEEFLTSHETSTPIIERTLHTSNDRIDAFDESLFCHDSELHSALSADLVWIDAQTGTAEGRQATAGGLLQLIQRLRSETMPTPSALPVLIVSSIHGFAQEVAAPFTSGLSESRIHVPLWIAHGADHACRIQALAGSFDLLPTLTEYLIGTNAFPDNTGSVNKSMQDESGQLSGRPTSLVGVCEHRKPLPDRLLRLTGDSWNALRTQQYLLVHPNPLAKTSEAAQSSPDDALRTARRLYLKPDDVWNVNDAIVSYAAIADQMEEVAAESERGRR